MKNLESMNGKNQKLNKKTNPNENIKKKNKVQLLFSSDWFILLLLFFATLIVYLNSFVVPFQFDDQNQISYRVCYHSFEFFKSFSNWFKINGRPISFFTFTINYVLHGEKVFGYHLVNFIIHFVTGNILFFWLKLLPPVKNGGEKFSWFPVVVTLFFLLHPVQTQSVTYIIQRMTALSGLFLMLAVYLYTIGRFKQLKTNVLREGILFYFLSFLAGVMGVLSKQNSIIFPIILLLVELFFIRNHAGKLYRNYFISATFCIGILLIIALIKFGLPAETHAFSRIQYLATQMKVIPRYFQMMFFPVGLSIDHGVEIVDGFFNLWTILGALTLLSIIVFAFIMVKKIPLFSFGIFWIFITLVIESSIIPITDPMFDQRMYMPTIGFSIAIWALADYFIFQNKRYLIKPVIIPILLLFSIMTIARNNVWQSRVAIWEDVVNKYPNHLRGWMALGKMYNNGDEKNVLKSIKCFEKARNIDPENEENLLDLGFSYLENRQEDKALDCYSKLSKSSDKVKKNQALKVLSAYNVSKGNSELAEKYLKDAIAVDDSDPESWENLYSIYFKLNDFKNALEVSSKWLAINPNNAKANFYMGKSWFYLNDRETARKYLIKAIQIDSNQADAMMLYANTCVNKFDYDEAILYLDKAYAINKNSKIPEYIAYIKQLKIKIPKKN